MRNHYFMSKDEKHYKLVSQTEIDDVEIKNLSEQQ